MTNMNQDKQATYAALDAWIDQHFDEEVQFLQALVQVPTDTPPGNNAPHAERTAELLKTLGYEAEKHTVPEAEVKARGAGTGKFAPKVPTIVKVVEGDDVTTYEYMPGQERKEIGKGPRLGDPILRALMGGGLPGTPAPAAKPGSPVPQPRIPAGAVTATGPNGEKIFYNEQTQKWEPVK